MSHPSTISFIALSVMPMIAGIIYVLWGMSPSDPLERTQIVVTVKNSEIWIEGYIRSFYRQGVPNSRELWFVDLGSRDDTLEILKRFSMIYPGMMVSVLSGMESTKALTSEKNIELGLKTYEK